MARPKRFVRTLSLLVLGVAVLASGVLAFRANTTALRRGLVEDIHTLHQARYLRPVQTLPVLPGRFGALAAEPWTALAEHQALSTDVEFCRAVREGETPLEKAPPSCLRELALGAAPLSALLHATHALEAGPPPGLGVLDVEQPADAPRTFVTAAYAARMAGLQLRVELGRGDAEAALATCLDVLGLARDMGWGTALQGRVAALTVSDIAFVPCAAALDAAPVAAKRRAAVALAKVARGMPPLAETLWEFSVATRAQRFAPYLKDALPSLPENVQRWAHEGALAHPSGLSEAVRLGSGWHALDARLDSVVAAARLPPAQAAQRLGALSALPEAAFAALGRLDFPDLGALAQGDGQARAQLLLLRRAAEVDALRAETGAWPRPEALSEELRSTAAQPFFIEDKGAEAVLTDASSPRGALELHLHADK